MPFYEYECSNCKFYVEVLQKISDEPLRDCPSCKKSALKKLVSAPVFRLKGDGWYETDFKSENEGQRNLADRDEPAEKSDGADQASTESKAESADTKAVSKPDVSSVSGKKTAAKAEPRPAPRSERSEHKGKPKAAPAKPAKSVAKPTKASKPAAKKAPAKKKAKRR
jgi:putative FmdB family regulatory protein